MLPQHIRKIIVALVLLFGMSACTDEDGTRRVLTQQGYTDIKITGWRPFAGNENDVCSTGFVAKAPSGAIVRGTVTSGWLTGNTIRLD